MALLLPRLVLIGMAAFASDSFARAACAEGDDTSVCAAFGPLASSAFERLGKAALRHPPQVRDRESLPDSHLPWMPDSLGGARQDFPAVFRYGGSTDVEFAGKELEAFLEGHLPKFGVVVVKGLPLSSPEDFSRLMHSTNMTLVDYVGGVTSRPEAASKVTPASTEPAHVSMEPHVDNPYWPVPPARLILFVGQAPKSGGQALVSDTRAMLRQLREQSPKVLAELERRHVRYEHFYPDRDAPGPVITSWQDSLAKGCDARVGCNEKEIAEAAMRAKGFGFEWVKGGLKRWEVVPPVVRHPVTGEEAWANMLTAMHCTVFDNHPEYPELNRPPDARGEPCTLRGQMPYHTTYGDGANVPVADMHAVRKAQWNHSVSFDYEVGDLLAIDNYHAMHGRFSFQEPRELYLTMVGR